MRNIPACSRNAPRFETASDFDTTTERTASAGSFTVEILDVRVERLDEITEAEARREGFEAWETDPGTV